MNRDAWGALRPDFWSSEITFAHELLSLAIKEGKLPRQSHDFDKRGRGTAMNYVIYDIAGNFSLVQKRVMTVSKYGTSPKKDYYLIQKFGDAIIVHDMAPYKHAIVKMAKKADRLGELVEYLYPRILAKKLEAD